MPRILSTHGNVIAADFRPHQEYRLGVDIAGATLFADDRVMLMRYDFSIAGKPFGAIHCMADLTNGTITSLPSG